MAEQPVSADSLVTPGQPVAPAPTGPVISEADAKAIKERKSKRKDKRARRAKEGEIKELSITAMMDMMTIILVFLLKSFMASSQTVTLTDDLKIPRSTTTVTPQDNIAIAVALSAVLVNDKPVCKVVAGSIPEEYRPGNGAMIPALFDALQKEVDKQKLIAKYNPKQEFTGKLNLIADKRVPYHTLLEVLYTAGQAELGQYKLLVLKND